MEEQNLTTAKKKKWLLPAIIAVIVVVAAIATAAIYNLPANRLNRQLRSQRSTCPNSTMRLQFLPIRRR